MGIYGHGLCDQESGRLTDFRIGRWLSGHDQQEMTSKFRKGLGPGNCLVPPKPTQIHP